VSSKVARLRQELQVAELEEPLSYTTVTNSNLHEGPSLSTDKANAVSTGPTIRVEIKLDGQAMVALVDTGSPVPIVFIDFLLKVILAVKGKEQRDEEFKQLVMRTVNYSLWQCRTMVVEKLILLVRCH